MDNLNNSALNGKSAQNWLIFILVVILILWTSHAIAFFSHEFAHAFSAWLLGWKSSPLALNYGHLTTANLIAQFEIDENVNYAPIFASENGHQAGVIALAGLFIGNFLVTYPLSRWGYNRAKQRGSRMLALFFYWLCVASIGNLIDYVPVRTFAAAGDMNTLARAFNCSPWTIILLLGIPFAIILVHFFFSFAPRALHWIFPQSASRRIMTIILTVFVLFGFYGAAGWSASDPISHNISVFSVCALMPMTMVLGCWFADSLGLTK